jgi:para-nitrobenzyl esterase
MTQLRALSVEEIVDEGAETDGDKGPRTYSGPVLDGKLVTETSQQAYSAGRVPRIPIIIGSNSAEIQGAFVVNALTEEELFYQFGGLKNEAIAAYNPDNNTSVTALLSMVNTDKVWAEPARFTADAFVKKGVPAYVYLFSYVPDSLRKQMPYGASHGSEIAYVFNNLDTRRGLSSISPADQSVSGLMITYWSNFAKTGNPNGKGIPEWPVYQTKTQTLLEIGTDGKTTGKPDPKKHRLDVIEKEISFGKLQKNGI